MPRVCLGYRLLLALTGSAIAAGCADTANKDSAVDNPSFDDWCDKHLCDWDTDEGRIEPASTWHKQDLAVSLLDTPTQISQLLKLDRASASCISFDTIADVVPEALVSVEVDFNDDGVVDHRQQISALRWKSVPFVLRTPVAYNSMRLSVVKNGTGRAVLAQMRVVPEFNCAGAPFTLAADSKCRQNEVCTSGRCEAGRCLPCPDGSCTSLAPAGGSE